MMMWNKSWKYFEPEELLSPVGLRQFQYKNLLLQPYAIEMLVLMREICASPLYCNSGIHVHRGYRSWHENKTVSGAVYSRHMQGIAFDLHSLNLSVEELEEVSKLAGFSYTIKYQSFLHVDARCVGESNEHRRK